MTSPRSRGSVTRPSAGCIATRPKRLPPRIAPRPISCAARPAALRVSLSTRTLMSPRLPAAGTAETGPLGKLGDRRRGDLRLRIGPGHHEGGDARDLDPGREAVARERAAEHRRGLLVGEDHE